MRCRKGNSLPQLKRYSSDSMSGTKHHVRELRDSKGRAIQTVRCLCVKRTKLREARHKASLMCRRPGLLHTENTAATRCYHLLNTVLFDKNL